MKNWLRGNHGYVKLTGARLKRLTAGFFSITSFSNSTYKSQISGSFEIIYTVTYNLSVR